MNITWYHSQGTQEVAPAPVNLDWCPDLVYLHKNVQRLTITDPDTGETSEVWDYDEAVLSRVDYAIYLSEQNAEDIISAEQEITDHDLALIEAEQEITDMDIRIMELENAKEE